jgi:hypothetical protein
MTKEVIILTQDCKSAKSGPGCGKESTTLVDSANSSSDSTASSSVNSASSCASESSSEDCPK